MTAPDDVRARFEAWATFGGECPDAVRRAGNGDYVNTATHMYWLAWQAAHADLAGEVRELVGAAEEMVGVYVAKYAMESGTTIGPLEFQFRALEAALAKLHPTHQEKP